jgi:hypothetical protein
MKHTHTLPVFVALVIAVSGASRATAPQSADADLAQIEQRLIRAWLDGDQEAIRAIVAPDWSVIDIAGRIRTREQVLQDMFAGQERPLKAGTIDDVRVRMFGDVGVVTGRTRAESSGGVKVALRFTDVFARRDGRWWIVASQGAPIAPRE